MQLPERGSARRPGAQVDHWSEGGWWQAAVLPDAAPEGHAVVANSLGTTFTVPLGDLRTSLTWSHGRWSVTTPRGVVNPPSSSQLHNCETANGSSNQS